MSNSTVDASKRTWLIASSCAGAVGAGFVAVPFVASFQPSERAKAAGAPVEADISALQPGQKIVVSGGSYLKRGDAVSVSQVEEAR